MPFFFWTPGLDWCGHLTETPVGPNAEDALYLQHNLFFTSSGVQLCLCSQLSFLQMSAGYHDAGSFLEQGIAILFLALTVLEKKKKKQTQTK